MAADSYKEQLAVAAEEIAVNNARAWAIEYAPKPIRKLGQVVWTKPTPPPLTEDDLVKFGLALEAAEDVAEAALVGE